MSERRPPRQTRTKLLSDSHGKPCELRGRLAKPSASGTTDVGRSRAHNEDRFLVAGGARLVAVADGMGGHEAGEVAAEMLLDALARFDFHPDDEPTAATARLVSVAEEANARIHAAAHAGSGKKGMGTTLVAGLFVRDVVVVAHAGDSRAYLLRGRKFDRLTRDHSLREAANPDGKMPKEILETIPANVILRAIGTTPRVEVETSVVSLEPGDRLLFSSDGLTGMVSDRALATILSARGDRETALEELVRSANAAGGDDNITAVIVDIESISVRMDIDVM